MLHLLAACKKYIKNGHKCCEKHAKALMDLRKKCVEQADDCLSVTSSTIASSTASSKKLSKLSGTKKVTPPQKKKLSTKHDTPEDNRVSKYLITPKAINPKVPATVSTVTCSVSSFG